MEELIGLLVDNGASGALIVVILRLNATLNKVETRLQLLEDHVEGSEEEHRVTRNKFQKVYEVITGLRARISGVDKQVGMLSAKCDLRHQPTKG